jgi:hypothetical protein
MANPLIAIIGSVHPARAEQLNLKNAPAGEQAAEMIGHALAKQGCRIVAYSDKDWSVESLVIKGYVAEYKTNTTLQDRQNRIEVHYSQNDEIPHFPEENDKESSALFLARADRNPSWASSFYRSLGRVDGVILLVGSHTTYVAGTVALSHRKSVFPVAAFGGTAEDIWKELSPETGVLEQSEIEQMATPIRDLQTAERLVKNLLVQHRRMREQQKRRQVSSYERAANHHIFLAVPFFIFALAAVPFTWDNPNLQTRWLLSLLLLAPLLAGIAGATARTAFEALSGNPSQEPPNLLRTCGLGAIAGG